MDDETVATVPPTEGSLTQALPTEAHTDTFAELGADPTSGGGVLGQTLEMLQTGGPVVALLLAMSVVALTIVFLKLWQFSHLRIGDRRTARAALQLYRDGRIDDAVATAEGTRNPAAQALAQALRGQRRGVAEAAVREEVARYGGDALFSLRSLFRPLEVIASLAPLLGLFGTVLGMIEAFRQLEGAAGGQVDPAILSGGIWVALLTTAVGLAVAMPAVALLNWLERRVDGLAHEMNMVVTQVFTEDLSHDGRQQEHRHEASRPHVVRAAS